MSNSASISAAKRRRAGVPAPTNQMPGGSSRQINRVNSAPVVGDKEEQQLKLSPLHFMAYSYLMKNSYSSIYLLLNYKNSIIGTDVQPSVVPQELNSEDCLLVHDLHVSLKRIKCH